MGTITSRKRRDGSIGYTAQIRLFRDGKPFHTETQTFERKAAASAWIKKRESEIAEGKLSSEPEPIEEEILAALEERDPLFRDVIETYVAEAEAVRPLGKTKNQVLNTVKESSLGKLRGSEIGSKELVDFARFIHLAHFGRVRRCRTCVGLSNPLRGNSKGDCRPEEDEHAVQGS